MKELELNFWDNLTGTEPERLLYETFKKLRLGKSESESGISPLKLLKDKSSCEIVEILPIDRGIGPSIWFLLRLIRDKFLRLPISTGNCPIRLLLSKFNVFKEDSLDTLLGRVPLIEL